MQVYLVGGAVRDELLGRPVSERDWVVVGSTPEQMERDGYRSVGRDFPVFLHPQSHEEYALARRERKIAPGYRGFTTQFSPDVTLEEDLQRRDLTVNAMARAADGRLIDPYGGQRDLSARLLRHVSPAFVEDPVRVLRVARFAARFADLGFTVAPETMRLMRQMVDNGEVRALVPERTWREFARALHETQPQACFETLHACGGLPVLLPELRWDESARAALCAAVTLSEDPAVRFAALLARTPVAEIQSLSERLRVPSDFRELALLTARCWQPLALARRLDAAALVRLLETADALRRPERFQKLLLAARAATAAAASHGRSSEESLWRWLAAARDATAAVELPPARLASLTGPAIAAALREARAQRLTALIRSSDAAP